jgi:hypothetical protein
MNFKLFTQVDLSSLDNRVHQILIVFFRCSPPSSPALSPPSPPSPPFLVSLTLADHVVHQRSRDCDSQDEDEDEDDGWEARGNDNWEKMMKGCLWMRKRASKGMWKGETRASNVLEAIFFFSS